MSDRLPRLLAGALLLGISLLTLACGLPNDVRYEIGTKAVSPAGLPARSPIGRCCSG